MIDAIEQLGNLQLVQPAIFTTSCSSASFTVSNQEYFRRHPDVPFDHIAVGALVFRPHFAGEDATPRILLIQRAASDSMPGCWEIPGGASDDTDESILHSVARELHEETGLVARHIMGPIGEFDRFTSRSGKRIAKVNFIATVEYSWEDAGGVGAETRRMSVRLDPSEHQAFVWASEAEVVQSSFPGVHLHFTTVEAKDTILKGFQVYRTLVRR